MTTNGKPAPTTEVKKAKPEKRIYHASKDGKERLVRASSNLQAQNHLYAPDVRLAKGDEIARLVGAGVQVEDAK